MQCWAVFLCCVLVTSASVLETEDQKAWEDFVNKYQKTYASDVEREFRFKIFTQNLRKVALHNIQYEAGEESFKMGVNKFSDMLESEVVTGINKPPRSQSSSAVPQALKGEVRDSFDWREKGAVTPVKSCGSCCPAAAMSAIEALEGQEFLLSGELVELSLQQIQDCLYGGGCSGGWMDEVYQYIIDNGGIDTAAGYPNTGKCDFDPAEIGAIEKGYVDLPHGDEEALKVAVATVGPISVGFNVNTQFQMYAGGILKSDNCSPVGVNHALLLVGYGTEGGQDYWILKNSWGSSWGENGYIRAARNYNNMCGVAQAASYPTV